MFLSIKSLHFSTQIYRIIHFHIPIYLPPQNKTNKQKRKKKEVIFSLQIFRGNTNVNILFNFIYLDALFCMGEEKEILLKGLKESSHVSALLLMCRQWSYGVVMWEVLTRGVEPYPNVKASDVVTEVQTGKRLPKPKHCPIDM